ncbi:MAG: TIGR03619 family F420-dependent LLM class oxidoreductase [Caulobacteraceae bacterium]|nr:TIGR03619 family F420-dependent LLM class oxidoreductase [Caulobacteraceae bacterium]
MSPPVKVGLNIVWAKPELVVRFARLAEDLGFESVWSGEHVALPQKADWWRIYPSVVAAGEKGSADLAPFRPESPFLDPMVVLSHISAATKRVRLGIGIYLLALRNPVLVGRTIASLDLLSNGRLDLGVGLGWTADEYSFTENEWTTRGRRMDELIRCLRALFGQDTPEFHGEFFDFPPIGFEPKPVQRPRLPIHVGGFGPAAERRAAALGDGWYGSPANIPAIRERLKAEGRAGDPFQFSAITLSGPVSLEAMEEMARQGVHRVVVTPWPGTKVGEVGEEGLAALERYARDIGLA